MTETGSAEVVTSAAGELSDPMQVYCPACEVSSDGENERVVTAVVSFLTTSVILFAETLLIHSAVGILVSPKISSLTMQVRLRSVSPASPFVSDSFAAADKLSGGTEGGVYNNILSILL